MANWNSRELQTPAPIKKIGQNAQNAINNLDILLKLVKQGADVAKMFLLLTNPARAIIRLAADEIIKLCNDLKKLECFICSLIQMMKVMEDKRVENLD